MNITKNNLRRLIRIEKLNIQESINSQDKSKLIFKKVINEQKFNLLLEEEGGGKLAFLFKGLAKLKNSGKVIKGFFKNNPKILKSTLDYLVEDPETKKMIQGWFVEQKKEGDDGEATAKPEKSNFSKWQEEQPANESLKRRLKGIINEMGMVQDNIYQPLEDMIRNHLLATGPKLAIDVAEDLSKGDTRMSQELMDAMDAMQDMGSLKMDDAGMLFLLDDPGQREALGTMGDY